MPGEVAYIGDFLIDERHRRRGYGAMTLTALEEHAAAKGLQHVALNVFDHNPEAKALYEKMGYKEVREDQGCMQMAKSLKAQH